MRTPDKVLDVGAWLLENGHRSLLKLTGGRVPRTVLGMPPVELHTVDGRTRPMRARTASPEEKAALWPTIVAAYRGYEGYQRNTERDIPVVICEPDHSRQ